MIAVDLSQYDQLDRERARWLAREERGRYSMQVANLWEHVLVHLGEDIRKRVCTFLLREDFLDDAQRQFPSMGEFPLLPGKALNAARLDNDDIVAFPPFPAPEIPGDMKVGLTRFQ